MRHPIRILWLLVLLAGPSSAFSSSEHKLVGDLGASQVTTDPSIQLPPPTRFLYWLEASPSRSNDLGSYRFAKQLAVGFDTNDVRLFADGKSKVQDNAYPPPIFGQRGVADQPWALGNLFLWIPEGDGTSLLADHTLVVEQYASGDPAEFTFGELVALYGDFRRTVHCIAGKCHLTDADIETISFLKGTELRPDPLPGTSYLKAIASGLSPPYGALANTFNDTAGPDEYAEAGWWGDEMLRIAAINEAHFSTVALLWYVGMHRYALYFVEKAIDDPRYWNVALSYEANGLHSLTDLFCFGHMVPNRDETSYGVMIEQKLTGAAPYRWQQQVLTMGGAVPDARPCPGSSDLTCRRLLFPDNTSDLPEITAPQPLDRSDYMPSNGQGAWSGWALTEKGFHDKYNDSGACVRNIDGDSFLIFGDGRLQDTLTPAQRCGATAAGATVAAAAVRASLQSLFAAHAALKAGKSVQDIGGMGSDYFAALRKLPVYVIEDLRNERTGDPAGGNFKGCWMRYALAADAISGAGAVGPEWARGSCQIPYLNGGHTSLTTESTGGCGCSASQVGGTPLMPVIVAAAVAWLGRRRRS